MERSIGCAGALLNVTSGDPAIVARIRGLGFFGLMASPDHHREHRMMIALGEDAHGTDPHGH